MTILFCVIMHDFLVDRMSPEFGLIDKLYSNGTLTGWQKSEIEDMSLIHKRNNILLHHIVQKNACDKLLEALKECGQSHLVKYIEANGVYRPEFGGNWPLEEKESTILLNNYETLIDLLESRDLVGVLYQTGVLNRRQKDLVSSKSTTAGQNKVLLEILRRGSLDCYYQTIRCLYQSNQSHIARIFESGGVVVRIDANLQPMPSNLSEVENFLAKEITNLLRQTSHSEAGRILEKVQLDLVGAAATHSVSLYFLCSNVGDIDRLKQVASDGQLKKFVEDLFSRLMKFKKRIKVTLKWSTDLFSKSRKYLKEIQVRTFFDEPMKTTIECLPLELLESILQKAYLWSRLLNGDKNSDIIRFLASVDKCWFQRIRRKRFKKPIWPQLERIYKRKFEIYFIFRGCLRYLEEAMQVKETRLTRRELLAADFITDLQIAKQLRKHGAKAKRRGRSVMVSSLIEELYVVRRGLQGSYNYNNFISLLRQTKRTTEASVLEQEGTTAKVEIRRPKNSKTDAWSRDFSSRLNNNLKDEARLKSEEMKTIIQKLKSSELNILNSSVDRDVSVWISCKSPNAVENLKELHKSETLIDLLYQLANENDRIRSTKDIHLEDFDQLKIDTISPPNLVINSDGELLINETNWWPIGVTKLKNKIFVLGRTRLSHPFSVYVFDDQHPFRLQREMAFEDIKFSRDISSFEKNFCLYIAEPYAECIWKICPPDEDKIKDGEFKSTALKCAEFSRIRFYSLTITAKGQILIVDELNSILLFCESESDLNCPIRIDLPDDIYRPRQVAENSAGNFIFLHRTRERYPSVGNDPWAVSEVVRNGEIIIRQQLVTREQWLIKPYKEAFVLVDSKDRIFILHKYSNSLILLDSCLRYVSSLALDTDKTNVPFYPKKMFIDGGKSQLIVAGRDKVLLYKVTGF